MTSERKGSATHQSGDLRLAHTHNDAANLQARLAHHVARLHAPSNKSVIQKTEDYRSMHFSYRNNDTTPLSLGSTAHSELILTP